MNTGLIGKEKMALHEKQKAETKTDTFARDLEFSLPNFNIAVCIWLSLVCAFQTLGDHSHKDNKDTHQYYATELSGGFTERQF